MAELRDQIAEAIADTNLHDQADLDYETSRVMAVAGPVLDGWRQRALNAEKLLAEAIETGRGIELDRDVFHGEIIRLREQLAARNQVIAALRDKLTDDAPDGDHQHDHLCPDDLLKILNGVQEDDHA